MIRGPTLLPQVVFQMKERLKVFKEVYEQTCQDGTGKATFVLKSNLGDAPHTPPALATPARFGLRALTHARTTYRQPPADHDRHGDGGRAGAPGDAHGPKLETGRHLGGGRV